MGAHGAPRPPRQEPPRVTAYEQLLAEDPAVKLDTVEIHIPAGPRLGDVVVEAAGLRKGYGDRLLIDGLDFSLPRRRHRRRDRAERRRQDDLFRMIAGQEEPDGGECGWAVGRARLRRPGPGRPRSGEHGVEGDQRRQGPHHRRHARDGVAGVRRVVQLPRRRPQKRVGDLSGGERNRLHLAKLLRSGGNLLLLDEPTNDLDVDTLRALEEALVSFAGCAVVISHDRWFLDRVATHILGFEGDSEVVWFEGAYDEYEENRRARLGAEADQPHRIKYKPLVRP